jgi:ABC-type branched-subunit amino acid transport system permease subunit
MALLATSPAPARASLIAEALPIGIFLVLAVLPLVALATGGGYLVSLGSRVMIFAVAAVALDLLLGYGGLISFGHAAFIAALLIGLADTLGRSFSVDILRLVMAPSPARTVGPAIASMLIYLMMALVLYFRPTGLFPPKGR